MEQGFDVVEYKRVNAENIAETVAWFSEKFLPMIFHQMGWCFCMMILLMANLWGQQLSFQGMRLHLSGLMRLRRQP